MGQGGRWVKLSTALSGLVQCRDMGSDVKLTEMMDWQILKDSEKKSKWPDWGKKKIII